MANESFVSVDIGKLDGFIKKSAETIKEFNSIKKDFETANKQLLKSWKGIGADAYKAETDNIFEKVGGIADVLNTINEGVVKDLINTYKKVDQELHDYNVNAGKENQ